MLDENVFQAMLNPLSDVNLDFLEALALEAKGTDRPVKTSALEHRLGITHGTFQTYRKRLLDTGLVNSLRRGELSFAVPLLAHYVLQRREE